MSDLIPVRNNVQTQGAQFLSAVSENLIQTMAGASNFNNYFNYGQKDFFFNGFYSTAPSYPQYGVDGFEFTEFPTQIIDVWLFGQIAGSSGTTEVDIQVTPTSGGSWTSIFTTTPKISYLAGNDAFVGSVNPSIIGQQYTPSPPYVVPTNVTQGVLNAAVTTRIAAWSAMRCVLVQAQTGASNGGCIIHYRNVS